MRKTILLLFFCTISLFSQNKINAAHARIHFDASVPYFAKVAAVNDAVQFTLDPKTSTVVVVVPVKQFKFKYGLMEEHFNDVYLETHKFPKSYFKGKIQKFDLKDVDENAKEYIIRGKLMVRGRTKDVEVKALVKRVGANWELASDFPILLADYLKAFPDRLVNKINSTANTSLVATFGSSQQDQRLIVISE